MIEYKRVRNSVGWAACLWLFLVAAFPLLLTSTLRDYRVKLEEIGPCLAIVYAASRLTALQLRGGPRLLRLCHWLFVYIFFGLVPLLQLLNGNTFPAGDQYTAGEVLFAYVAIAAGLLGFEIGCSRADNIARRRAGKPYRPLVDRVFTRRRVYAFAVVAVLLTTEVIILLGGLATLFLARYYRVQANQKIVGGEGLAKLEMWSALLQVPSAIAFLCLLILCTVPRKSRRIGLIGCLLLAASAALVLLISNPVSAARYWVGTIFLGTAFIIIGWNPKRSIAVVSLVLVAIFAVVFPVADAYRATLNVQWSDTIGSLSPGQVLATKPDFDGFQQVMNTVRYVRSHGFTYGRQLTGSFLFWVPRSIWVNKPEPTSMMVAKAQGYSFTNLSLPLWGELYVDGGLPLIFLGFLLYGRLAARLERDYALARYGRVPAFAALFVPIFAPYEFYLLRGSFLTAMAYLAPVLACMWANTRPRLAHRSVYAQKAPASKLGLRAASPFGGNPNPGRICP